MGARPGTVLRQVFHGKLPGRADPLAREERQLPVVEGAVGQAAENLVVAARTLATAVPTVLEQKGAIVRFVRTMFAPIPGRC